MGVGASAMCPLPSLSLPPAPFLKDQFGSWGILFIWYNRILHDAGWRGERPRSQRGLRERQTGQRDRQNQAQRGRERDRMRVWVVVDIFRSRHTRRKQAASPPLVQTERSNQSFSFVRALKRAGPGVTKRADGEGKRRQRANDRRACMVVIFHWVRGGPRWEEGGKGGREARRPAPFDGARAGLLFPPCPRFPSSLLLPHPVAIIT